MFKRAYQSYKIHRDEYPLKYISNRHTKLDNSWAIPNVCYQTWVDNFFGRTHAREIEVFRDLNPEITWILFDEEMQQKYMLENWGSHEIYEVYTKSKFGPMRADIFRYCLLFDRGGYYFDISKGCSTPLREMHKKDSTALISYENNICLIPAEPMLAKLMTHSHNLVIQWGFGFAVRHPILAEVISLICSNASTYENVVFPNPKNAILSLTGPGAFTLAFRRSASSLGLEGVAQSGVDFNGTGIYALPGSYVRYFTRQHYTSVSNSTIL